MKKFILTFSLIFLITETSFLVHAKRRASQNNVAADQNVSAVQSTADASGSSTSKKKRSRKKKTQNAAGAEVSDVAQDSNADSQANSTPKTKKSRKKKNSANVNQNSENDDKIIPIGGDSADQNDSETAGTSKKSKRSKKKGRNSANQNENNGDQNSANDQNSENNSQKPSVNFSEISRAIRGISSNFGSMGNSQYRYSTNKILNENTDFLIPFSVFSRNCEMFFALTEAIINNFGGNNNQGTKKGRNRKSLAANLDPLNALMGNGISALRANMKCSATILLQVIGAYKTAPSSNLVTLNKLISTFLQKYNSSFDIFSQKLENSLTEYKQQLASSNVSDAEINSLVNDVQLIREIVNFLNQYTSGNPINDRQVSNLIQKCSLSGN